MRTQYTTTLGTAILIVTPATEVFYMKAIIISALIVVLFGCEFDHNIEQDEPIIIQICIDSWLYDLITGDSVTSPDTGEQLICSDITQELPEDL